MYEWNPIKDRLPKEDGDYLCTIQDKLDRNYQYLKILYFRKSHLTSVKSGFYNMTEESGFCKTDNVIAWMELPKPYGDSRGANCIFYKVGKL